MNGKLAIMAEARTRYRMDDFRAFMRQQQGITEEDFNRPIPDIQRRILESTATDPGTMFCEILQDIDGTWPGETPPPSNNQWHHFIVPGVLLAALRNAGAPSTDEDIWEGMERGRRLSGGSCGFMGICGGAHSIGITLSVLHKVTPVHDAERAESMQAVATTLQKIADSGPRCCKRSSYIALSQCTQMLQVKGYDISMHPVICTFTARNPLCLGKPCPFHPKHRRENRQKGA